MTDMHLLERAEFFEQLQNTHSEMLRGRGRLVLVSGEAGIGKTSLVEQFAEKQKNESRVLWGGCDALFTPRPLGPIYDIARQIRGDLLTLLEEEASRSAIFAAVFDELQDDRSTLLIIEDAHWADEATLDLLKFIGRRINKLNALLVVTYRDDEVRADHPLRLVLGDLPRQSVTRIRLPPLSEVAAGQLAEREGKHIEDLHALTGGNPFFITEALANNGPGVPVNVSDAVLSRVGRLSAEAREVVELVSVVPAKAELWLLDDTIKPETAVLEECLNTGILLLDNHLISFRHELARRAVEDSLPALRAKRVHGLVLNSLLKHGPEKQLPRVVHHAAKSGEASVVLKYAPVAAQQAAALNAHRESASHYKTALNYPDLLSSEQRADLLERLSYECYVTGQISEAWEARRQALEVWRQLGHTIREGDNLRWLSRFAWYLGRKHEAEECGNKAVEVLETLPDSQELAWAYSNRAQLHMLAGQTEEAVVWGSRAIELAQKFGATETLVHALNNVGMAQLLAHDEQGRVKLEESLRLSLAHNLEEHASRAYTNLSGSALMNREYSLALRYLDEGIAYANEYDLESCKRYMTTARARVHFEVGQWTTATDDAAFVLEHSVGYNVTRIPALTILGHVRVRRGDPDASQALTEAYELAMQTKEYQRFGPITSARAEMAWLAGDREQVLAEVQAILEMTEHNDPWLNGECAFWLWRAGVDQPVEHGIAEPYALQISGNWRAAADVWKKIGCPYEAAMALVDGDEAAQLEALAVFEELGAGPAAERLRRALRATGVRGLSRGPRLSTKENSAGLTARQMDVLALMSDGCTNAEIADRLFISYKTVDHHVSAILAKLDARTRAEAVSIAFQSNLIKIGEPSSAK
ncbi:MAG TPA: AAA family ATPase [Pyrinomonadaceae bacterium]|nr:AAA family ATPase [Pyrinomonadaceae bacterium]